MYNSSEEISSLISSRICHDLASPLGAIANGMELLELSGMVNTPETSLINDSIAAASARVEFFRIAFGNVDPNAVVSPRVAQKILADNFNSRKFEIRWLVARDIPKSDCKLLFLITQCAEVALPYGAEISVTGGEGEYQFSCKSREVRLENELWAHLSGSGSLANLSAAQVQFALAHEHAVKNEILLSYQADETTLAISVSAEN